MINQNDIYQPEFVKINLMNTLNNKALLFLFTKY